MEAGSPFVQVYLQDHQNEVVYTVVAPACIFFYDYLLTLHLEIKLIWLSRWSYTKVLFLMFRYSSFIQVILFLKNLVIYSRSSVGETCKVSYHMQWWMIILQAIVAEVILSIRTWAVWERNRAVGIILALSILASLIPQSIFLYNLTRLNKFPPPPYPGFKGCFGPVADVTALKGTYATLTGIQAIFLSLMVISGIRSCRDGGIGKLSFIIYRDGILFYIYILCMSLVNLLALVIASDRFWLLFVLMEGTMYAVFTTRIILNIRYFGRRTCPQRELHTTYEESYPTFAPMEFALHSFEPSQSTGQSQPPLQESQGGGDCADTPV